MTDFCDWRRVALFLIGIVAAGSAWGQTGQTQTLQLIHPQRELGGWTFDNGREFPGAEGKLELATVDDAPTLLLHGDFSGGGNYVQAATALPMVDLASIAFDIKVPAGVGNVTTRLIDGTGQCHQLDIRLNDKGGWQRYTFPVARYFASLEAGAPMDIVTRYEKWSGANDGRWHQPAKLFVILAGRSALRDGQIAIRNVVATPTPPKTAVPMTVRLDELGDGLGAWEYNNGDEFRGARGGLAPNDGWEARRGLTLRADFTEGGRYVGARQRIQLNGVKSTQLVRLRVRSSGVRQFSLRMVDETGQCHQRHGIELPADGKWHSLELDPLKIAGGEHWGGADDGQWHGALSLMELMLNTGSSGDSKMQLELADIQADVIVDGVESTGSAWRADLTSTDTWTMQGDVGLVKDDHGPWLRLRRTLEQLQQDTFAAGPAFPVRRGAWRVRCQTRADLHSPDNSYHAAISLELFDRAGGRLELLPLGIVHGKADTSDLDQVVQIPPAAVTARLRAELRKTYGDFWLGQVSVTRLDVQPLAQIVSDIRIASAATGNLFLPDTDVAFQLAVNTASPLPVAEQVLRFEVRDYRARVIVPAGEAKLLSSGAGAYRCEVQLPRESLQVGQFYELHVEVPQGVSSPATEFSGFAVLPVAAAKRYRPEQIPFTIRNWDSRIREYFLLSDRLGLRTLGVWGGWSNSPPYKPHLPGIELCEQLDAQWITGTPAAEVERSGFAKVSEESLREGVANFLEAYAGRGLAKIALGNEPHGTGPKVLDNVKAYRAIYEAVKKFDPKIEVIGTSVEPNEEYFKAGYQRYLDSYDFHVYEHYSSVRNAMRQYRELMKKYDAVKPIHSTELGLNSAGQARLAVAIELIKKCTVFFAEGGDTVSWFTIQYPDPNGKARGQFGDAHCVFDCKFNNFNPRIDAIAYYHMINSLLEKKFVREQLLDDGTQTFLFRNGQGATLQIIWNDDREATASIAVDAAGPVERIRIDGHRTELTPQDGKIAVPVSLEPALLLYQGNPKR
ncbi:MAG: hypothetical protein KDB14_14805 [Planctomycetales bacterium]|nr:hypothetical protein [Planctomycetales bacterium]